MTSRGRHGSKTLPLKVGGEFLAMMDAIYAFLIWLFGNILWDCLLAAVFAGAVTYLKVRRPTWGAPALYFVVTFCAILVSIFTLIGRPLLSRQQPQTTPENVEMNVKAWADKFSLGIQKQNDDKLYFAYALSLRTGRVVLIARSKGQEGYLHFQGNVELSPEHEAAYIKLKPDQQIRITDEVSLEMARNKVGFTLVTTPFKGIVLTKEVPITSSLTEDTFLSAISEIDNSLLLAREAVRLSFFRNGFSDSSSRPAP